MATKHPKFLDVLKEIGTRSVKYYNLENKTEGRNWLKEALELYKLSYLLEH
jgi:hypothetical protein